MQTFELQSADGQVLEVGHQTLRSLPDESRIPDVSALAKGRTGRAVRLSGLLRLLEDDGSLLADEELQLTLHGGGGYETTIRLAAVIEDGFIIYEMDDEPLPQEFGGPFRFLVPDTPVCGTAEVDSCVNVKGVLRLVLSNKP